MNVTVPDALLLHHVQSLCLADDSQDDLKLLRAQSLHLPLLLSLECVHRPARLEPVGGGGGQDSAGKGRKTQNPCPAPQAKAAPAQTHVRVSSGKSVP